MLWMLRSTCTLDILRISLLVSCLSVVTNQITKIYGFLKGVKEGGEASQSGPVDEMKRASRSRPFNGEIGYPSLAKADKDCKPKRQSLLFNYL
jgi:hypothetical protein